MSTTICFYFYPLQIKAFAKHFYSRFAWSFMARSRQQRRATVRRRFSLKVACQYCTRGSNRNRNSLCTLAPHKVRVVYVFHLVLLLTGFSFLFYWHHYLTACVASTHSFSTGRISHFISFDDLRNGKSFFMDSSTFLFFFFFFVQKVHSHSRFMSIIFKCWIFFYSLL